MAIALPTCASLSGTMQASLRSALPREAVRAAGSSHPALQRLYQPGAQASRAEV